MATYSNNSTIAISSGVSTSYTWNTNNAQSAVTLYTCPANSYAEVNVTIRHTCATSFQSGISLRFSIGGNFLAPDRLENTNAQYSSSTDFLVIKKLLLGPGQVLALNSTGIGVGSATLYITGVQFINTP
jgi:hypothetical protein